MSGPAAGVAHRAVRESFELTGAGGLPIRGEMLVVDGATHGVVLLHGFKGFFRGLFFPSLAERIAAAGLNVVSYNCSGSGIGPDLVSFTESAAFGANSYGRELYDLSLVMRHADASGWLGSRYGLFGHSRGGGIAALHAAGDDRVGALVTWASISTVRRWTDDEMAAWRARGHLDVVNTRTGQRFALGTRVLDEIERHGEGRLDITRAARRITAPWLVVHGDADDTVLFAEGEQLAGAAPDAELFRIAGGTHTMNVAHGYTVPSPELLQASERTVHFLTEHLAEHLAEHLDAR